MLLVSVQHQVQWYGSQQSGAESEEAELKKPESDDAGEAGSDKDNDTVNDNNDAAEVDDEGLDNTGLDNTGLDNAGHNNAGLNNALAEAEFR